MRQLLFCLAGAAMLLASCGREAFSPREREIINCSDSVMYVTLLSDDSLILRTPSRDLSPLELRSPEFRELCRKMLATVRDPRQDGVGIAAPQVGIDVRLAAVQRYDRPGKPFEFYPNLHILKYLGDTVRGPEGCLSVPPMRGIVPRAEAVVISYVDPESFASVTDTVRGYTAIIFQHETDHLDARLYIDRADTLFVSTSWQEERLPFEAAGAYRRPEWWK